MTTKTTNLTFAELWPLVRDGQCFEYQDMEESCPWKYIDGQLNVWINGAWSAQMCPWLVTERLFKLVDDPSKSKEDLILCCLCGESAVAHKWCMCRRCSDRTSVKFETATFPLQCDVQGRAIISAESIERILSLVREQLPQWLEEMKK